MPPSRSYVLQTPTRFRSASPSWPPRSARDFPDDLHLVAVLKGAFMFLSDLVAHMTGPRLARLHGGVELREGHDDVGRSPAAEGSRHGARRPHVVIVEDIVDTGLTLTYLQDILRARNPKCCARRACSASRRGAGRRARSSTSASRSRIASSSATASTTPNSTATCRTSPSSEPDRASRAPTASLTFCRRARSPRQSPAARPACARCRSRISTLPFTIVVRTSSPRVT